MVLAIFVCLAFTVVCVCVFMLTQTSNYTEEIMINNTHTYLNILSREFDREKARPTQIYEAMTLNAALKPGGANQIRTIFQLYSSSEEDFCAAYTSKGELIWASDNFDIADFDFSLGEERNGVRVDSAAGLIIETVRYNPKGFCAVIGMHLDSSKWLDELKAETNAEFTLYNGSVGYTTTIVEDGVRAVGEEMPDVLKSTVLENGDSYGGTANILGQNHYVTCKPIEDINGNIVGAMLVGVSSEESDDNLRNVLIMVAIASVVIGVISLAVTSIVCIRVTLTPVFNALRAGRKIADDLNRGLLHTETGYKASNDEMGEFVKTLVQTESTINTYITDIKDVLARMATGDFTARPAIKYEGDFASIEKSFSLIYISLSEIIRSIDKASGEVLQESQDISEGSRALAEGATRQAASIEQLSASINEISVKIRQSAKNAAEAGEISARSAKEITLQNGEVNKMMDAMDEIKQKSDEIRNIIEAIDDIAFQTNILALNAAVEAARAGEAGKGFAVVADEVNNLAYKSAKSARQTGELINATIAAVDRGTEIAQATAETMKEVTNLATLANRHICDISAASAEQAEFVAQVKIGVETISTVVQQNSATAQQTAAACADLSSQSDNLKHQIEKLKV
ncbi:MAG: methyl-accepting chemotaxis protein [Oscillospiraceae bacterium]|nr:methyl-accepting chemotaxis protein [Oscillospiraceae bacterium]